MRFLLAAFRFVVCVCDPDPTTLPTTRGDAFLKAEKGGIYVCPDAALNLFCDLFYERDTDGHKGMVKRIKDERWSEDKRKEEYGMRVYSKRRAFLKPEDEAAIGSHSDARLAAVQEEMAGLPAGEWDEAEEG